MIRTWIRGLTLAVLACWAKSEGGLQPPGMKSDPISTYFIFYRTLDLDVLLN